ncbi:MAG: hypothetical protein V1936_03455 [Patescibacteria group bacterium]
MDFNDFADLLRRRWLVILIITLAATIAAGTVYFLQPPRDKLTLLFSVGVKAESPVEQGFDFTKASDDFANSVAGWLRSPTLAERISGLAGTPVALGGETQAKQNFLVEATFLQANGELVSAAVKQILAEELEKYDADSKFKFFMSQHGESVSDARSSLAKTLSAAAFGGILLGIAWLILAAALGGQINSVREAEEILGSKAIVIFRNPKKDEAHFLKKLAKKGGGVQLVGIDFDIAKLRAKLDLELKTLELPRDAEKIGRNETKIVVVRLDESRVNTLRMLRALAEEKIELVIWA